MTAHTSTCTNIPTLPSVSYLYSIFQVCPYQQVYLYKHLSDSSYLKKYQHLCLPSFFFIFFKVSVAVRCLLFTFVCQVLYLIYSILPGILVHVPVRFPYFLLTGNCIFLYSPWCIGTHICQLSMYSLCNNTCTYLVYILVLELLSVRFQYLLRDNNCIDLYSLVNQYIYLSDFLIPCVPITLFLLPGLSVHLSARFLCSFCTSNYICIYSLMDKYIHTLSDV